MLPAVYTGANEYFSSKMLNTIKKNTAPWSSEVLTEVGSGVLFKDKMHGAKKLAGLLACQLLFYQHKSSCLNKIIRL